MRRFGINDGATVNIFRTRSSRTSTSTIPSCSKTRIHSEVQVEYWAQRWSLLRFFRERLWVLEWLRSLGRCAEWPSTNSKSGLWERRVGMGMVWGKYETGTLPSESTGA